MGWVLVIFLLSIFGSNTAFSYFDEMLPESFVEAEDHPDEMAGPTSDDEDAVPSDLPTESDESDHVEGIHSQLWKHGSPVWICGNDEHSIPIHGMWERCDSKDKLEILVFRVEHLRGACEISYQCHDRPVKPVSCVLDLLRKEQPERVEREVNSDYECIVSGLRDLDEITGLELVR